MTSDAKTVSDYIKQLPKERIDPIENLRKTILRHLDPLIEEQMEYGMIGYVIPHSVFPDGYHCDPQKPLPYMSMASQKNYLSVYHMALYMNDLEKWFIDAYQSEMGKKPNMGKCCIRFTKMEKIPYALIGQLAGKVSAKEWIEYYQKTIQKKK